MFNEKCLLCSYGQDRELLNNAVVYSRYNTHADVEPDDYLLLHSVKNKPVWMILGESPTTDEENYTGMPLTGNIGILLENMLNSVGLNSMDAYITLLVKCKACPKLIKENIDICYDNYLKHQINKIKPRIVLTLGSTVTKTLLSKFDAPVNYKDFSITRDRGKPVELSNITILPTYNLTYLLRYSLAENSKKYQAWQDVIKLKQIIDSYTK